MRGFDVPVDEAGVVNGGQSASRLSNNPCGKPPGQAPAADPGRPATDKFTDQKNILAIPFDALGGNHVGMSQVFAGCGQEYIEGGGVVRQLMGKATQGNTSLAGGFDGFVDGSQWPVCDSAGNSIRANGDAGLDGGGRRIETVVRHTDALRTSRFSGERGTSAPWFDLRLTTYFFFRLP